MQQVLGGHALEHHRRGLAVVDAVGELDQPFCGHEAGLRIGPRRPGVGDAGAGGEIIDAVADGLDDARRLHADGRRKRRQRIEPGAVVDVDEVEADGGVPDTRLAGAGIADRDLLPDHLLGAAGLVNADCLGHELRLLQARCSAKNAAVRWLASAAPVAS